MSQRTHVSSSFFLLAQIFSPSSLLVRVCVCVCGGGGGGGGACVWWERVGG